MNDWQPIETAPKDGTSVLVLFRGKWIYLAHWKEDASFHRCETRPGWQVFDCDDCWYSVALDTEVTHWMPLPALPEITK